jgi:hypothetical protein
VIETMAQVVFPGWLTVTLESENTEEWCIYRCVDCGFVPPPPYPDTDAMLEHTSQKHESQVFAFALQLYLFRSALARKDRHLLGLQILEWPDRIPR